MTDLTYATLLDHLFPRLTGGIRWGLDRTVRLLAAAGDPHTRYPSIHVAGTNGKGSVAVIVESVLRRHGLRTGLYTSPHLVDFRERIQVAGRPIGEPALLGAARDLWPALESEAPSFFEATTVLAFECLARAGVEVAVVEVGMGGRLDATNVVRPEVTVITNVALDHAQYLGPDLASIAAEKAGVIKPGVPVVTGELEPEVAAVVARAAAVAGSAVHRVATPEAVSSAAGTAVSLETSWGRLALGLPLAGRHQASNLAVAVRALELLPVGLRPGPAAVVEGVAAVRWPGRLQVERIGGATWVLDVAHNAAGVASLMAALPELGLPRPVVALVGVLGDKDWEAMLPPLVEYADAAVLAEPPTAPAERRWDPERVVASLGAGSKARVVRPFGAAVEAASRAAQGGTVICTGSVHTVGDAMVALGVSPFGPEPGLQGGRGVS